MPMSVSRSSGMTGSAMKDSRAKGAGGRLPSPAASLFKILELM